MNKSNASFLASLKGLCNRTFLLMLLIEALNNFATTTVKTPINVFGAALGASAVIIGLSSSLYNFTATATRPFSGFAMSRVNHKRWLQICMILRMASFALFIVTNNVVVYVIAKCFQGLAYAAAATVIPAVIGSANSKAALGTAYGFYLAAPRIITSFAPLSRSVLIVGMLFLILLSLTIFFVRGSIGELMSILKSTVLLL